MAQSSLVYCNWSWVWGTHLQAQRSAGQGSTELKKSLELIARPCLTQQLYTDWGKLELDFTRSRFLW